MYIFYGLVVSLIVFEAFVIQSDAVGNNTENIPQDEVKLPYEVLGHILHKAGLNATKAAGRSRALMAASRDAMSRIFEDRILEIGKWTAFWVQPKPVKTEEHFKNGQSHFYFGNYAKLISLFETYGEHARRISINYQAMDDAVRRDINKNIVTKYANYFTELHLYLDSNLGFWEQISNENGKIQFPNVKKLTCECIWYPDDRGKTPDLNEIFPKLESIKLIKSISDAKCLANVKNLKEFTQRFSSMPELQLKDIFAKNKQISKLSISPQKTETLQFIEKYLRNLKTLEIKGASDEVLFGGNRVSLPSVTSFSLEIYEIEQLRKPLSFELSNLKKLKVHGNSGLELPNFINRFRNLDSARFEAYPYTGSSMYDVETIMNLANVKEYTSFFQCEKMNELRDFFKTFDETKSKLISLKLICARGVTHHRPGKLMDEINYDLMDHGKPTWTLTEDVDVELGMSCMIFERNL